MFQPRVSNEFARLRVAVVHDASNAIDITLEDLRQLIPAEDLARHPESGDSFRDRVIAQHAVFRQVLADHGVELLAPEAVPEAFCQVFARDPSFVIGERLFVASLRDEYRHCEPDGLTPILERVPAVIDLRGDGSLIEGGDVMPLSNGQRVLVGMHRHTNEAGCQRLVDNLPDGVEVIRVPHHALHLDCCLAPLPTGEALYSATELPGASVDLLRTVFSDLIPLNDTEARLHLAANVFWINERTVVSNVAAPHTNRFLRGRGFEVIELDFSNLVHLWGSFRCVVCPLIRE